MGTTAEKLNYLKETKTEIKNALEIPSNIFRDYPSLIKKYINNQPTSKVSNGVCTNALDVPLVSLGVDGQSEQKVMNQLVKKIKLSPSGNIGSITYNENTGENICIALKSDARFSYLNDTIVNHKYYVSCEVNSNVDGIFIMESSRGWVRVQKNIISNTNTKVDGIWSLNSDEDDYRRTPALFIDTVTFPYTMTVKNLMVIDLTSMYGAGNEPSIEQFKKDYPNEYYEFTNGLSPNPDNPQDIEVIKGFEEGNQYGLPHGCIGLEQSGKNKFNNDTKYTYSNTNVNCTKIPTGIRIEQKDGFALWVVENLKEYVGKTVRAKTNFESGGLIIIGLSSLTGQNRLTKMETNKSDKTISFVIPELNENQDYLALWLYGASSKEISYENITITIDNEDMTYEPYHSPKLYPINLNGNSIAKVGDVKDLLKIYRNGDVEIEKKIEKVVLNGTEKWNGATDFYTSILASLISECPGSTEVLGLSNAFLVNGYNYRKENNLYFHPNKNLMLRNPEKKYYATLAEWKSYLSEQYANGTPVYVDYQLAEPKTIKLPSIEPITLWEGTNKFKLITNLDTTFEMEYVLNKDYLETQNLLNAVEGENI